LGEGSLERSNQPDSREGKSDQRERKKSEKNPRHRGRGDTKGHMVPRLKHKSPKGDWLGAQYVEGNGGMS